LGYFPVVLGAARVRLWSSSGSGIRTGTASLSGMYTRGGLVLLGGGAKGAWLWVIFGWRILFGSGM